MAGAGIDTGSQRLRFARHGAQRMYTRDGSGGFNDCSDFPKTGITDT
jgi:hypothetical protein